MKKFLSSFFIAVPLVLAAAGLLFGQSAATATWALSADTTVAVSGSVNAMGESVVGLQSAYEVPPAGTSNQVQKLKPDSTTSGTSGTGSWPTETAPNAVRYVEFSVAPQSSFNLTVNAITMWLGNKGIKGLNASIYYSTHSDFSDSTMLVAKDSLVENAVTDTTFGGLSVAVNSGETLYIRVYPWLSSSSTSTSKYMYIGNVVVAGTTMAIPNPSLSTTLDWNFQSDAIGESLLHIGWSQSDIQATVADDPVKPGQGNNVLKCVVHNYNAAPVLEAVLPAGKTLADYDSLSFDGYFQKGDVAYKYIVVQAYQNKPTGHFLDTDTLGSYNRSKGTSTNWEHISIDISNTKTFSDTVYIAFGINCSGTANGDTTTWYADNIKLVAKATQPSGSTLVSQWGKTSLGTAWPLIPDTTAGSIGIGNGAVPTGWSTVSGHFSPLTATTTQAVVVTGQMKLVGGGGTSAYTWLRYALTYQDSATLQYKGTDSAMWSSSKKWYGYEFDPISGAGTMANGSGGEGTVWAINNGNWASTYSNGGPPLSAVKNQPYNAEAIAGTYNFAISVESVNDTVNELRWYLVEQNNKYWFGGTIKTVSTTKKFNSIDFGFNNDFTGTQVNFSNVKAELGTPITVPAAPWQAYYLSDWGKTSLGTAWPVLWNDSTTIVGNAGLGNGKAPTGWSTISAGFGQSVPISTSKAIIVTGQMELVGGGGTSAYTWLRYALTYQDSATLQYKGTDSAMWTSPKKWYGYEFDPRSGAGTIANGSSGQGTEWAINNGNWTSTYSNGGPALSTVQNQPFNAEATAGTYNFAISVESVNDTVNEIRWYLIKNDNSYWFGGIVRGVSTTKQFNAIDFGFNNDFTGTQVNFSNVKVDLGKPITVPPAPWQNYYISDWGFYGSIMKGWSFTPGELTGNATISGSNPTTGWVALRGGFGESVAPRNDKDSALVITGDLHLGGGGFQGMGSLRFGLFNSDSAGTVILDTSSTALPDSTRWSGTPNHDSGYLFIPPSDKNPSVMWSGNTPGTLGGIMNDVETDAGKGYSLGTFDASPSNAVGDSGTYNFTISIGPAGNGTNDVRFIFKKNDGSYELQGSVTDKHSPVAASKFNSIVFALGSGSKATDMNLENVQVTLAAPPTITGVKEPTKGELPTTYSLSQNYPNPFNPSTTIKFAIPHSGNVSLVVYDILGRKVTTLVNGELNAGYHSINFNADNLASGVYFYRLKAGNFISVKKLMLLK